MEEKDDVEREIEAKSGVVQEVEDEEPSVTFQEFSRCFNCAERTQSNKT